MRNTLILITGLILSTTMVSAESTDMSKMDHSTMAMDEAAIEGAVHVKAVINSFGEGTVNVSHEPIPEIGWPAMTMDMPIIDSAEMTGEIAEGDAVIMMLVKGDDGMYAISALSAEM